MTEMAEAMASLSRRDKLVFFGPGLLLAITAAGEFGIIEATEIGMEYGLKLLWVVVITLVFKYVFTLGIAKYTLATGKTIFEGIKDLPGPKHWGQYLVIASYLVDIIALGSMIQFAAAYLDYILPGAYQRVWLSAIILFTVFIVIRFSASKHFEIVISAMIIAMFVAVIIVCYKCPISPMNYVDGMSLQVPKGSEMSILAIIGVCGNGLNIMLYSLWLKQRTVATGVEAGDDRPSFGRYIRSIKFDLRIGFILVFLITAGFLVMGYICGVNSLIPHWEDLTLDAVIVQSLSVLGIGPLMYIFPIILMIIFIGATSIGLDSRVSVMSSIMDDIIADHGKTVSPRLTYALFYVIFMLGMVAVICVSDPLKTLGISSAACAILFGFFGLVLIYMNSKMPEYARGSRAWITFVGIGSILSIYIALRIEGNLLNIGVRTMESMALVLLVLFLFTRTKTFKNTVTGNADLSTRLWTVGVFSLLTIYSVYSSSLMPGYYGQVISFTSILVIMAAISGGAASGAVVGLVGGIYGIILYGNGAFCQGNLIALVATGVLSGYMMRRWNGNLTNERAIILVVAIQVLMTMIFIPLFMTGAGSLDFIDAMSLAAASILSILVINIMGIFAFMYFNKDVGEFKGCTEKFSIDKFKTELIQFFKQGDE